jgi:predicted DNA-binding transcriptional regulator AlpA
VAKILSMKEIAELEGRSLRSVQRQNKAGEGPPLIQLSPRRIGVDEDDYRAWVEARRLTPEAQAAHRVKHTNYDPRVKLTRAPATA